MKISYNWLKEYISVNLPAEKLGELLTGAGLEVESMERVEAVKGGLNGLVVGEVKTKMKHPNADKLSITTVDVGAASLLQIVCGASNVEAGQKVIVAMVGATIYPVSGDLLEIKKTKIRGELSEGMICAEDEIGMGASHAGIMVLDKEAKTGMAAAEYFKLEGDIIFEIGLTPNRADAASHMGVARDLFAVIKHQSTFDTSLPKDIKLIVPSVEDFAIDNDNKKIEVLVEAHEACIRYTGLSISNIKVKESPDWLKKKLQSVGLRPINNIVDVTNYILQELGQPLHAFDADQILEDQVVVRTMNEGSKFVTLDGVERILKSSDLMICNAVEPMCIAGVYGGIKSGVTEKTTAIFLESACFDAVSIRKTSRYHGLKTDASFRYERGSDPDITVYAIKRAALLIKKLAGGEISSEIVDVYPKPVEPFKVPFSYNDCNKLIGKEIDKNIIKNIFQSLNIEIISEGTDAMLLAVPPFRVDVKRECDVIEEVLRIYGYNNVEEPSFLRASVSYASKPDREKMQNVISDMLSSVGFNEIMSTSLTKNEYISALDIISNENAEVGESDPVYIANPLSSELGVLRTTLLFSGLGAIAYNRNRKNNDLKLFEFGKAYHTIAENQYKEASHLSLFITGNRHPENWSSKDERSGFYLLKAYVVNVLEKLGIAGYKVTDTISSVLSSGLSFEMGKKKLVEFGLVKKALLKTADVNAEVFYADFNWDLILNEAARVVIRYKEVSKFPMVRRDLSMVLDKTIPFRDIEELAFKSEHKLLKQVNLFDVYEGDKIEQGKKSYAVSFILQDEQATLTDLQTDKVMEKLMKAYEEKVGAVIRRE